MRAVLLLLLSPSLAMAQFAVTPLAPIALPVGEDAGPQAIALVDVSGDGVVDLLAIDRDNDALRVLLGRGDGRFGTPVVYPLEGTPTALTAADFASPFAAETIGDIDGHVDILVAHEDGFAELLLGRGDGSFEPPEQDFTDVLDSLELIGVAPYDVDGNGRLDLVFLDFFEEVYFLCNEAGSFAPCATDVVCTDGFGAAALALADVDGDGNVDVAVASRDTGDVRIIAGLGGGRFDAEAVTALAVTVDAAQAPLAVAAAELDGAAGAELAVGLFGSEPRSLARVAFAADEVVIDHSVGGAGVLALATADLSGDGVVDALLARDGLGGLAVAVGDGAGGFAAAAPPAGGEGIGASRAVVAADIDGDGRPDVAVLSLAGDAVTIALTNAAPACVGDCNVDGTVAINELISGVNIAIGSQPLSGCPAFDSNNSGTVTIDELVGAVRAALEGCPR